MSPELAEKLIEAVSAAEDALSTYNDGSNLVEKIPEKTKKD